MKSKKLLTSILAIASIAMVGCSKTESSSTSSTDDKKTTDTGTTDSGSSDEKVTLNMSVYYDDNARHMKFISDNGVKDLPYTGADGNTYYAGDFKPVWAQIQKNLDFKINDLSPTGKVSISTQFTTLTSTSFKVDGQALNIAQGNSDQIVTEGTDNDTILDLSKYLDKMPNFKKFLEDNSVVKKTISANNGAIYYAPYFDGFDDIERMMMLREDWVTKLLDSDTLDGLDEDKTLTSSYTPFYPNGVSSKVTVLNSDETGTETLTKSYTGTQNIIAQMNAETNLTGKRAVELLKSYIKTVYGSSYSNPSELFIGGKAVYDVDELIALFRCVKLNAKYLTGDENGEIVSFFPRAKTSDRTSDLYRFLQFFGVRGVESRNQWMYVDSDGKLVDTRGSEEFATGLEKLHEMYSEGLIMEDFTTTQISSKDDYRGPLYSGTATATVDGKTVNSYGFATYDYNQTTTIYNDSSKLVKTTDSEGNAIKGGGMKLISVLPAVADFDDGKEGNFIHYTESWRSVKTQGWFITKATANDEKKLNKALELFDYLYSDAGNRLMSYGPDGYLAKNDDGTIKTMDYQGKQVPVLSDATKAELKKYTSGNYTNYYRYYLGGTLPVGYIKQQGMEYQTVSEAAKPSLNTINAAIQYGVLEHVNHNENENKFYDIVPTTLPFTTAENSRLASEFTNLNTCFTSDKNSVMTISSIVMSGWGKYGDTDFSTKEKYLETVNTTFGLTNFTKIYNAAYTRFKAL